MITYVTDWITAEYFDTLGYKAMDIAKIVSHSYYITNDELSELKSLSYEETLGHPANKRFSELFKHEEFSDDFKFAYISFAIRPEQVKYYVTDENAKHFDAVPGTPLNVIWLVYAVLNQTEYEKEYYEDIYRYSWLRTSEEEMAHKERRQAFVVSRDKYGNAITGYVPIYTLENEYAGLLGIDINFERFEKHTEIVNLSLILIFVLPTVILSFAYILAYFGNRIELRQEAITDPLTSINNRRFLKNSMPSIIMKHYKNKNNLSVIMLDIDFFKKYNDNYGHQKGDEVLIKIAGAITSALRSDNDIACRYGGEEMIVILKNTGLSGAIYVAERIKNAIGRLAIEHKYSDISDFVTVSQGIYSAIPSKADKKTEEKFITNADRALYEAKNSGRNKYMIYKE